MNARSRAKPGLGRYQPGSSTASGSIFSMSMTSASPRQVQIARSRRRRAPAPGTGSRRAASRLLGSVMISVTPPEPDRRGQVGVGRHQHRHRAQPRQRGDGDQRTGPGLHQHTDAIALAHADLDQAAHDVVDAAVDRLVGVHAPVEQQELAVRGIARLLVDDAAQRDPGVVVDLPEPGQPRQRAGGLHGQRARRFVGGDDRVGRAARQPPAPASETSPSAVDDPGAQRDTAVGVFGGCSGIGSMPSGMSPPLDEPAHPVRDGRPGLLSPPWSPRPGRNGLRGSGHS